MKFTRDGTFKPTIFLALSLIAFPILMGTSKSAEAKLMAHWKLDQGAGKEIKDSSGNKHHGVFKKGNPEWVPGISGSALKFDGDDYVEIDAWITETGSADFSITAWIKTDSTSVAFLVKNDEGRVLDLHEKLFYVADAATSGGGGTGAVEWVGHSCDWIRGDVEAQGNVADGKWHHVGVTWELKKTKGHIYVDGQEGVKHMGYNGGADIKGNTWKIGLTSGWPGGIDYKGVIDDIRIYDEALTEAGVVQAMEKGQSVDLADKLTLSWGKIKAQ